jgi:bifunctional DNA-binding transcriptional regulator/antitoxin component of YhaV-PrlF toxin-antitoxin module
MNIRNDQKVRKAMTAVRLRGRGQVTLPASLRDELGWKEDCAVDAVKVGDAVLLAPRPIEGDRLSRRISKAMKSQGLTLEHLLKELKSIRRGSGEERRGR